MNVVPTRASAIQIVADLESDPRFHGYRVDKDGSVWARVWEKHDRDEGIWSYRVSETDNWVMDGFVQLVSGHDFITARKFTKVAKLMLQHATEIGKRL